MSYEICIPGHPPNMNRALRSHWAISRRERMDWYQKVAAYALGLKIPRPAFESAIVELEIRYRVRQRGARKHDAGNYEKCVLDALVRCRILRDDSFPALNEARLRARPAAVDETVITVRAAE